jgi:hypothetical protein
LSFFSSAGYSHQFAFANSLFLIFAAQEKERLEREQKKKEQEEFKAKLKGNPYIYIKKENQAHPSQLDKLKNLREGNAEKQGIMLPKS